jgi:hypothetical protein
VYGGLVAFALAPILYFVARSRERQIARISAGQASTVSAHPAYTVIDLHLNFPLAEEERGWTSQNYSQPEYEAAMPIVQAVKNGVVNPTQVRAPTHIDPVRLRTVVRGILGMEESAGNGTWIAQLR